MIPDYDEILRRMDKILEDEMTPKVLAGPYELGGHNPPPFYKSLIQDYNEMRAYVVDLETRLKFLESRPVYLPPPLELDIAGYPKKQQVYPGYPTWQYVTTVTPPPTK